jgi:hypothetical protein
MSMMLGPARWQPLQGGTPQVLYPEAHLIRIFDEKKALFIAVIQNDEFNRLCFWRWLNQFLTDIN